MPEGALRATYGRLLRSDVGLTTSAARRVAGKRLDTSHVFSGKEKLRAVGKSDLIAVVQSAYAENDGGAVHAHARVGDSEPGAVAGCAADEE